MSEIAVITAAKIETPQQLKWLAECIGSVQAQTFKSWTHVVVDDGSAVPLHERLSHLFPHVKFLRVDKSVGPGEARNLGARSVRANYLFCLDSDDTLRVDGLEHLYTARCQNGYVYGDLFFFNESGGEAKRLPDWSHEELAQMTGPVGVTALQPMALFYKLNGWSKLTGLEDIEYWIRAAEIGVCGQRIDKVIFNYRQHPDSRTQSIYKDRSVVRAIREQIKEKHRQFFARNIMPCSRCPQGQEQVEQAGIAVPEGTVALKYQGSRQAAFFTPFSPVTNKNYRVEGKGAWVYVDPRDVAFLLQFQSGGRPDYLQTDKIQAQALHGASVEPYQALPDLPEVPAVFDITAFALAEAVERVENAENADDLRLWLAQEKAQTKPRAKLVRALETRLIIIDQD